VPSTPPGSLALVGSATAGKWRLQAFDAVLDASARHGGYREAERVSRPVTILCGWWWRRHQLRPHPPCFAYIDVVLRTAVGGAYGCRSTARCAKGMALV
jgi:hypothetical protein